MSDDQTTELAQASTLFESTLSESKREHLDVHVAILINYIRPHHVVAYRELASRVRKLTVLLSVPMEPDRDWEAAWDGLDVRVQRNFMIRSKWKHSNGFKEPNFIHIPVDTYSQLKSLKPDIVFSYEMGMRTLISGLFRRFNPTVPLIMVGNMSQTIELERGVFRRALRRLICKSADYFTYNGPSCKRYLESLRIPANRLFHLPYCIDETVVHTGKKNRVATDILRLIYCGSFSQRKGVLRFAKQLKLWCMKNPDRKVCWELAGAGELQSQIAKTQTANLEINFLGNCDVVETREAYKRAEICVFPSLADEWGLVPIEAMASGLPVLGSVLAQSVEAVVEEGRNGWRFDPTDESSMSQAIDRALNCDKDRLVSMGQSAKGSVKGISPQRTASEFCYIIKEVLPDGLARQASNEMFPEDLEGAHD